MRSLRYFSFLLASGIVLQAVAQVAVGPGTPVTAGAALPEPGILSLPAQISEFFAHLLDPAGWPPRWHCGRWTDFHGWLYIISDLLIWGAYCVIPLLLVQFIRKRNDVPFDVLFWMFALFIVACGTTHLLDALIFYVPVYRLDGLVRLFTAVVSWGTVVGLMRALPRALTLKTPTQLEAVVRERTAALNEANHDLRRANEDLETKITFRTLDLERELEKLRLENVQLRKA